MKKDLYIAILATPCRGEYLRRQLGVAALVVREYLVISKIVRVVCHLVSSGSIPYRSTFLPFGSVLECFVISGKVFWQLSVHRFDKRS